MNTYKVKFNPEKDKGIYALSIVEDPAMEGMFIALNKDIEVKFAEVNKEQKILLGVALIPDKPIYRNMDGEEFNIVFDSETIKASAHYFLKNQFNNNSTIEHEVKLNGMSVVESWIVEDKENDKQKKYGFSYPEGSWMVMMKVDDEATWNDYVKTGKVKGFSIDGLFSREKITNLNMSDNKTILEEIKTGFADLKALFSKPKVEVKLGSIPIKDSGVSVYFEGETIAEGQMVFTDAEMTTPAPDGEHNLDSGLTITVKDGAVTAIKETVEASEEEGSSLKEQIQDLVSQLAETKKDIEGYKTQNDKLVTDLQKELEEKKAEILELSKQPAAKPIKKTPEAVNGTPVNLTREQKFYNIIQNKK